MIVFVRRLAGDFGFDPLGLGSDPRDLRWYVQAELVHARFAMAGVAGILFTDVRSLPELFAYDANLVRSFLLVSLLQSDYVGGFMNEDSTTHLKSLRSYLGSIFVLVFLQNVLMYSFCVPLDGLIFHCGMKRAPINLISQTLKHFL